MRPYGTQHLIVGSSWYRLRRRPMRDAVGQGRATGRPRRPRAAAVASTAAALPAAPVPFPAA